MTGALPFQIEDGFYVLNISYLNDEEDLFTVHCLKRPLLDISKDARFIRLIRKLEA